MKKSSVPRLLLAIFFLLVAHTTYADSFSFSTLPPGGTVIGEPGSTVGWGYSITNDSINWLMITAIDAGSFLLGMPDAFIFDFPILEPGATATVTYVPGASGLFEFTWDLAPPVGFENIGTFFLSGSFWDRDPLGMGAVELALADQSAPYTVRVSSPGTPVPEPSTLILLALASVCVFLGKAYFGRFRPSKQSIV